MAYPYLKIDIETRNAVMNDIAKSVQEDESIRGYLILGYDLLNQNYPYSVIGGGLSTKFFDSLD